MPENIKHCHDTFEILYVISGEGRCIVEGSSFDFKVGSMMIFKPFEYHCIELSGTTEYERFVLNFTLDSIIDDSSKLITEFINNDSFVKYYSANVLSSELTSIFERFENAANLPEDEKKLYLKMLLSELLLLLSCSGGEYISNTEEELGTRVIKYLNEHINKDVSLDNLAKRFHYAF